MSEKPAPISVLTRPCFEQDVQMVQFIYEQHVLRGTASFETTPPDLAEMRARWARIVASEWPFLVAFPTTDPTRVLGFAYAAHFNARAGYARTFEDSVYVAPSVLRRGVGVRLLYDLLVELDALKAREVIAQIGDSENTASIALHARMGFQKIGVLPGVGQKFGRWLDVVLMQRRMHRPADD